MKKIYLRSCSILLFLFFIIPGHVLAQQQERFIKKVYHDGGLALAGKGGGGLGSLEFILKNRWSASLSYCGMSMDPKELPEDYEAAWGFVILPFENNVYNEMKIISISAGKYFPVGTKAWFTTEAGPSFIKGQRYSFTKNPEYASGQPVYAILGVYYPSNYNHVSENKQTMGALIKADFTWAFASFMGIGVGGVASLNSIQSFGAFQVKLSFGWMNRK